VVGVLLVLGCALAFTDASLHLGNREEVLVVAQPLAAGQMLTTGDLQAVRVSTGSGLQAIPVAAESSVVGRNVSVPLGDWCRRGGADWRPGCWKGDRRPARSADSVGSES